MNIEEAVAYGKNLLEKQGIEDPQREACLLLSHLLRVSLAGLFSRYGNPLDKELFHRYQELIHRRAAREPSAYIMGSKAFWDFSLKVDPRAMIPRWETELLVEEAKRILSGRMAGRVLEIGTGTAAVAIALSRELEGWEIWATDISGDALELARENCLCLGVDGRVRFVQGDLFSPLRRGPRFDLILSNPPYVSREAIKELPPEVKDYEPRIAIDGGERGMEKITRIIEEAPYYLIPGGWLLVEIGFDQSGEVQQLARARGYEEIRVRKDLAGVERVLEARWNARYSL